jgi:hypothetical protein
LITTGPPAAAMTPPIHCRGMLAAHDATGRLIAKGKAESRIRQHAAGAGAVYFKNARRLRTSGA